MPGPQPVQIELGKEARHRLQNLVHRHLTPQQLAKRAQIVLMAAEGKNQAQIARSLGVTVDTARLWRNRWFSFANIPLEELSVQERLEDAPHQANRQRSQPSKCARLSHWPVQRRGNQADPLAI